MNEQGTIMNQQQKQQLMHMNHNLMNPHQPQPQMVPMNRSYGMWAPPPPQQQFQNPNSNVSSIKPAFGKSLGPRSNWKGRRTNKPIIDKRRKDQLTVGSSGIGGMNMVSAGTSGVANPNYNGYQPPPLNELQQQNPLKARKFFPKKKFNKNNAMNMNMGGNVNCFKNNRSAPFAPRNTSSFLIRAKRSGGIAPLVSPCPVTPAVLPTPNFSPSKEVLVDMAKEKWGVDGYGSMKGLIRLRSPGHELEAHEDEEEDEGGSSESDVEEHLEVERRLDHDLSRFEMIYDPNSVNAVGMEYNNVLENRVDDQDSRIAQLEEENLILKERLFLMEREFEDLRRRMKCLGRRNRVVEFNEEVVENDSENDSESREEGRSMEENAGDFSEDNIQGDGYEISKVKGNDDNGEGLEATMAIEHFVFDSEGKTENNDSLLVVADKNCNVTEVEGKEENNNIQFIEANKSPDKTENNNEYVIKANNTEENVAVVENLAGKLKAVGKADVESSDPVNVMLGGDVRIEEVEPAKLLRKSRPHTEV